MKQGLGRTDSDGGQERTRSVLVIAEVALSVVLLFGAGLMMRTLWALHGVNPGFDASNVLTLSVGIPATKFANPVEQAQFFERVLQRLRQLPGVQAAGAIDGTADAGWVDAAGGD